jgi:tetratricopeptide (TPR) repeat protein
MICGIPIYRFLILAAISLGSFAKTHAQFEANERIALEYFQSGEWEKAALHYQKLYEKNPAQEPFYRNLLACYKNLQDLKGAEKLAKKQISRFPKEAHFWVDLGIIYRDQGEEKQAKKAFDQALRELIPLPDRVARLAAAFVAAKETGYAISAYNLGESYSGKGMYAFEITDLILQLGNYTEASEKMLELLSVNPSLISRVQTLLVRYLEEEAEGPFQTALKAALLKEIQKNPSGNVYPDLLIWLFVQQKNFDAAIVQAKALDKRLKEQGERLMELGNICMENGDYARAVSCYEYVTGKGWNSYSFQTAKTLLVKAYRLKVTGSYRYVSEDLQKLRSLYEESYAEMGITETTAGLIIDYADLEAFYLDNPEKGKTLLEGLLAENRMAPRVLAEAKLKLADILIVLGDLWEPALLYGQVDKEFKNDLPGQEAKFRSARLAFFRGDFELAQSQVKVLKASTSKLIANDALSLSLIIIDNLGRDSVRAPLEFFAKADLEAFRNQPRKALETLDDLLGFYATHPIADEAIFKKAQIYIKLGEFDRAAQNLEIIYSTYPDDNLADAALFLAADLQEKVFENREKAMELFEKIITEHTSSLFTAEARKRYRKLRGDQVN